MKPRSNYSHPMPDLKSTKIDHIMQLTEIDSPKQVARILFATLVSYANSALGRSYLLFRILRVQLIFKVKLIEREFIGK